MNAMFLVGLSSAAWTGLLTVVPALIVALLMLWYVVTRRGDP